VWQTIALAEIARRARRHDIIPCRRTAARAGNHMVKCQPRTTAAVLAGICIACEESSPRDLARRKSWYPNIRNESNHNRVGQRRRGRANLTLRMRFEYFRLARQHQATGAPHARHIEGFVGCVEYEHRSRDHSPRVAPDPRCLTKRQHELDGRRFL